MGSKAELPEFSYLEAELGVQLRGTGLPEMTRGVFKAAFHAHQELIVLDKKIADSAGFSEFIELQNRRIELEAVIKGATRLLLAMRAGYVPAKFPSDQYVGSISYGSRHPIIEDYVGAFSTAGLRLTIESPLPPEIALELQRAKEIGVFRTFVLTSPARYSFKRGGILAPESILFGIIKTTGNELQVRDQHGLPMGAIVSGGISLEIARLGRDGTVIPARKPT